ncbi:MAG TPA: hypothetical protein PLD37_01830 [Usitatibacteraceae bacterium]|nr:hypothetical protein [Usitatibacteraceae bacterium]
MNLLSRLKACVADESEIAPLFQMAAKGGTRVTKSGAVEYLTTNSNGTVLATLRFKNGRITQLIPGPALNGKLQQDKLVQQFSVEVERTHGSFVSSRVLFSERPLMGEFKWSDKVRVSPCPRNARVGKGLDWTAAATSRGDAESHRGPPYPFILEVKSFRSPNPLLETNRALRDLDTYQYIMTLLLHGRVRYAYYPSARQWISVKRRSRIEYHLLYPGFDTGLSGRADHFARRRMKSAPVHSTADYYNHIWARDTELFIPSSLATDLEIFGALPPEAARCFKRACYWYALGVQMTSEPSLSTVAFSTAIECLLPRPSGPPCHSCKKPVGPGPTKLFKAHLGRYGTVPAELEARRDSIYAARSRLVHGSHAYRADEDFHSPSKPWDDCLLVEIVAQRSLIGWLRDGNRSM